LNLHLAPGTVHMAMRAFAALSFICAFVTVVALLSHGDTA
jgi:hypothetical protein